MANSGRTRPGDRGGSPPRGRPSELTPEHLIRLKKIDAIDANIRLFIRYGLLAVIAFFSYRSISVLAGQHTLADVGIKFMADVKIGNAISYAVGGGGVAYGAVQKKLRRDTIQKMGSHIKTLEKTVDANRSSSGLTDRGTTRPEDEL